jgi:hypothetical protein
MNSFDLCYKTMSTTQWKRQELINEQYSQGWKFVREEKVTNGKIAIVFHKMIPIETKGKL